MIEVHISYNLIPKVDEAAYGEWIRKAIVPAIKSTGIIEVRALRNKIGTPHVLITIKWEKLSDWASLAETDDWNDLLNELGRLFATEINVNIWGPSPAVPEPIRPPKN